MQTPHSALFGRGFHPRFRFGVSKIQFEGGTEIVDEGRHRGHGFDNGVFQVRREHDGFPEIAGGRKTSQPQVVNQGMGGIKTPGWAGQPAVFVKGEKFGKGFFGLCPASRVVNHELAQALEIPGFGFPEPSPHERALPVGQMDEKPGRMHIPAAFVVESQPDPGLVGTFAVLKAGVTHDPEERAAHLLGHGMVAWGNALQGCVKVGDEAQGGFAHLLFISGLVFCKPFFCVVFFQLAQKSQGLGCKVGSHGSSEKSTIPPNGSRARTLDKKIPSRRLLDFFFDYMAMRRPFPVARQNGFTLIELMLVLGVMAIIGTGILMLARHVDTSRRVEQETARVQSIFSGLDSAYANAADFGTDLSVATAINNGALPASALTGSRLLDTDGHEIGLSAVSLNGVTGGGAKVTFQSLPSGVCTGVVTGLYPRMEQIMVNGQTVKDKGSALLDPKSVVAACGASDAPSLALIYANAGALSGASANGGDPGLGPDRSGTPPPPGTGGTDPQALPDLALQQRSVDAGTAPLQATPEGCHTNTDAACSTPMVDGSQPPAATVSQAQSGYQNNAGGFGGAPSVH